MGLRTEKWAIAFRTRTDFCDCSTPYCKMPDDPNGWYADPFLFEFEGKTYLFAEYMSYKTAKGSIVFCVYNEKTQRFGQWQEIIRESFHMSYPFVFEYDRQIYILPETAEGEALFLYRAVAFPEKWERVKTFYRGNAFVDTTLLPVGGKAITYALDNGRPEKTLLVDLHEKAPMRDLSALRPLLKSRPGGKILCRDGQWIVTGQDCTDTYGGALIFYQTDESLSCFKELFTLHPGNITVQGENVKPEGVHTYNCSSALEVIDYKTYAISPVRIFNRILQKVGGGK